MRFIHTADWHLGRIFHNVSLIADQKIVIEQLITLIKTNKPDAVIIAGDVYDKAIPPEGAVRLLEYFINQVSGELNIPIIMTSGNHDNGTRLSFASSVLKKANVHIIGKSSLEISPIILNDQYGEVFIYPLAYLSPLAARSLYQDSEIKSHQDVIQRQVNAIKQQHPQGKRSLLIIHEFVIGSMESESERQLMVGGTSHISASIIKDFDYVAMGHLHRPQACGHEYIRYAGSLLKYSFSEVNHNKGVTEVIFDAQGFVEHQHIPLKPQRDMRIIRAKLEDILQNSSTDTAKNDFICAELLDEGELLEPMRRLKEFYPNALEIRRITNDKLTVNQAENSFHELKKLDVKPLFDEFYLHICGKPLTKIQTHLITEMIEQLEEEK